MLKFAYQDFIVAFLLVFCLNFIFFSPVGSGWRLQLVEGFGEVGKDVCVLIAWNLGKIPYVLFRLLTLGRSPCLAALQF